MVSRMKLIIIKPMIVCLTIDEYAKMQKQNYSHDFYMKKLIGRVSNVVMKQLIGKISMCNA